VKQYTSPSPGVGPLGAPLQALRDSSGHITLFSQGDVGILGQGSQGAAAIRIDEAEGSELFRSLLDTQKGQLLGYYPSSLSLEKDAFYVWTALGWNASTRAAYVDKTNVAAFGKYDVDLAVKWFFGAEPPRTAPVDSNITWTGNIVAFGGRSGAAIGADSFYLVGRYQNTYRTGATLARPTTTPLFVARYDFAGLRIWFRELFFEGDTSAAGSFQSAGIVLDEQGNLVVAASGSTPTSFIFKMSADDGSLL
jgi:hypothetical protein